MIKSFAKRFYEKIKPKVAENMFCVEMGKEKFIEALDEEIENYRSGRASYLSSQKDKRKADKVKLEEYKAKKAAKKAKPHQAASPAL